MKELLPPPLSPPLSLRPVTVTVVEAATAGPTPTTPPTPALDELHLLYFPGCEAVTDAAGEGREAAGAGEASQRRRLMVLSNTSSHVTLHTNVYNIYQFIGYGS